MSSWLIWIGWALVGMSFSLKSLTYRRVTWCLFLCQKAVGRLEQTSCLSFSSNFLISAWMFLQASCSSTFLSFKSSLRYSRCWVLVLISFKVMETETSWRLLISLGSGLLRNLNLTGWPKGWVVIPSLSMMKGYNRHMKGFPKMTLSVIFLTRTNVVLKHVLSWHTWALGILNSICIFPPLAEVNLSLVFLKYLEGMIPSWMQLRSAPEFIKAMTSNSKSLLMTILTLGCHFWKLILLMVSRNFSLDCSWTISIVGLTDSLTSS